MIPEAEITRPDDSMFSVYNILREACGVSQAEAAEFVHRARLDSVKSWCSDRRTAPQGVINDLQKLAREIHRSGVTYAEFLKRTTQGDVYIIGLPIDEQDARACGFPSVGAQMRAVAVAISCLPDDAEIRMVERVRGAISAPVLETERSFPTAADCKSLGAMRFDDAKYYTPGNVDRRKYEHLEDLGWVKGFAVNLSDVEYRLTEAGAAQIAVLAVSEEMRRDVPRPAPNGFQSTMNSRPRRGPGLRLELGGSYTVGASSFRVEGIDGDLVTVRLASGELSVLFAPENLFGQ